MDLPRSQCTCDSVDSDCSVSESSAASSVCKEKKKLSLTSLGFTLRRGRSLQFKTKRAKKNGCSSPAEGSTPNVSNPPPNSTSKKSKWPLRFNCGKRSQKAVPPSETPSCCRCMCYRRTDDHHLGAGVVFDSEERNDVVTASPAPENNENIALVQEQAVQVAEDDIRAMPNVTNTNTIYGQNRAPMLMGSISFPMDWIHALHEDCDEAARLQRALEMQQGVEPPANFRGTRRVQLLCSNTETSDGMQSRRLQLVCPSDFTIDSLRALFVNHVMLRSCPINEVPGCHTQVDFIHCLVPDLLSITNCSFYWGKMDRYEAESLLDGKPEGTFLLRDSAQEEFLFSVSFRKYERSLHARIEQWNHMFSFDSHDPGVYTSDTVCGLIEHYKDPSSCMFFEPVLTWPLHRKQPFTLQHLSRAVITSRLTYDNVNQLQLPKTLKRYLKEYHYRQKVRVERFDDDVQWLDLLNVQLP